MLSPLYDLDELVLQCRDERARSYIREAVASYRAGAFRASIVATWVAVCYDIMAKLHELAIAGDAAAEKQVVELTRIRTNGDVRSALAFEKKILEHARNQFELISHLEELDLARLLEDRNRCAHPSLVAEGEAYEPPGELARLHIRNSVDSLLKHPPAQGKYALERLLSDVRSNYFPTRSADAQAWMANGILKKPRRSLLDNFVISLVKHLLLEQESAQSSQSHYSALNACYALHPQPWRDVLTSKLSHTMRRIEDRSLHRAVLFFFRCPEAWDCIDTDVSQRIQNFIQNLPSASFDVIYIALEIPALVSTAERRARRSTLEEISSTPWFTLPRVVADRLVTLYLESHSFNEANQIAKQLSSYASELKKEHVLRLISGAAANAEITGSFSFSPLLATIKARVPEVTDLGDFDTLLQQHGLERFAGDTSES
ncbi:hypothetical protein [Xanthomonas vasicola]|uniref:Tetratricopeptide repeat protein n=2 Tax=Xanthomonas vasicola TaxID=56459 RepID=A0ABD7SEQ3_XANVA|nr:hypothetical protein [Xanthomonas vasicola]AZM72855.1 hypothetical protein CXP37_20710 [Xanthomonas vasicola pv. vasculorum]KGR38538.1 hypothetical protein NX04_19955 [Xanthomonas vasicola]KGR39042.1 hypothetical protein NX05_19210 [Xanthomonas vasicola]KGR59332.1 hypothetical protein NX79_15200 [Xanthomonas vasicola]MDO6972925.1 hypothetical protein [Xanthomonas vasicola]